MMTRRHGQALLILAALVFFSIMTCIYNWRSTSERSKGVVVVPVVATAREKNAELVVDSEPVAPQTAPTFPIQQTALGDRERRAIGMLPGNGLFDLTDPNTSAKCQQNSCKAKLYYRRDVTRLDLAQFMIAVQDEKTADRLRRSGFDVQGMTFGFDEEIKKPYYEIFTTDSGRGESSRVM